MLGLNLEPESDLINHAKIERLGRFGIQINAKRIGQELNLSTEVFQKIIQAAPLVLFRGFKELTKDQLLEVTAKEPSKDLLHWDFGPVMELKVQADPKNYLFSSEEVPFHWDGAFHISPSYLVFNCLRAPEYNAGGETFFCNTEMIWSEAEQEDRNLWKEILLTYETDKKAHYGGKIEVSMVSNHPKTGHPILRFAEPVYTNLNPVSLSIRGMSLGKMEEFLAEMRSRIYNQKYYYEHKWQDGDLLIADNHTLIHGRNAFLFNTSRHIRRVQLL